MGKPGNSVYVTDATDPPSFLEPDGPLSASVIRFTEYLGSIIAGASRRAVETLERAVSMDSSDELARENLARCKVKILEREKTR